tara:strand:- start:28437 stop:29003 length:567 start_codon:yes stop_codon:yes gene_type:complete
MALVTVTAATQEPVTLAEVKDHLVLDHGDDDSYLSTLVATVVAYLEAVQDRTLVTTTYDLKLDRFPSGTEVIELPRAPLASITSVTYQDTDDVTTTLAASKYTVDTASTPGRLQPAYDEAWPSTRGHVHDVTIRFVAGYGDAGDVPRPHRHEILLRVADLFENREGAVTARHEESFASKSLFQLNRVF